MVNADDRDVHREERRHRGRARIEFSPSGESPSRIRRRMATGSSGAPPPASSGWCPTAADGAGRDGTCSTTWSPRRRSPRLPASNQRPCVERAEGVSRPGARHGAGGADRRRPLRQRLEGDERRGGAAIDRKLRRHVVAIVGGQFKGGRSARAARGRWRRAARGVVAIGEAAPLVRDALSGVVPVIDAALDAEAVERGHAARRRQTASCCWRRHARVSTGSAITRSAAGRSRTPCWS